MGAFEIVSGSLRLGFDRDRHLSAADILSVKVDDRAMVWCRLGVRVPAGLLAVALVVAGLGRYGLDPIRMVIGLGALGLLAIRAQGVERLLADRFGGYRVLVETGNGWRTLVRTGDPDFAQGVARLVLAVRNGHDLGSGCRIDAGRADISPLPAPPQTNPPATEATP